MSATIADLRNRVLQELGRLQLGQSPQDQDKVAAETEYAKLHAELKAKGIVTWASTASIPDEFVFNLASIVAYRLTGSFGTSGERYQRIAVNNARAEDEIKLMAAPANESASEPTDY